MVDAQLCNNTTVAHKTQALMKRLHNARQHNFICGTFITGDIGDILNAVRKQRMN